MSEIKKFGGGKNMGGVNRIETARVVDIITFPSSNGLVITGPFTFAAGKGWNELYITKQSTGFEIESDETDSGILSECNIAGFIPKSTPIITAALADLLANDFIVRFWDNNRYCRIIGSLENPIIFKYRTRTGQNGSDKNGTDFTMKNAFVGKAQYYYQPGIVTFPNAEDSAVL